MPEAQTESHHSSFQRTPVFPILWSLLKTQVQGILGHKKMIQRLHSLFLIRRIGIKKLEMDNFTIKEVWLKRDVNLDS